MPANIIQVEFFYGDMREDLNGFMLSQVERALDETLIKKIVRFYDQDGSITRLVSAYAEAEKQRQHALQSEFFAHGLWKYYWQYMRKRRCRQLSRCRSQMFAQTLISLREANAHGLMLATETLDHHFRRVRDNERHEFFESACAATSVCVFVFRPNNLFADKNTLVTRAM